MTVARLSVVVMLSIVIGNCHALKQHRQPECLSWLDEDRTGCENTVDYIDSLNSIPYNDPQSSYNYSVTMDHCRYVSYTVIVKYVNGSDSKSCGKDDNDNYMYLYLFDLSTENFNKCAKIELHFQLTFCFSGCYKFEFTPQQHLATGRLSSFYKWLDNNYTKNDFSLPIPTSSYHNHGEYVEVKWDFKDKIINFNSIQYNIDINALHIILENRNWTKDCISSGTVVTCTHNLPVGNYTTEFTLYDNWRCYSDIFGSCSWFIDLERIVEINDKELTQSLHSTYSLFSGFVTFAVVFTVCMSSLVCWVIYKKRNQARLTSQQTYDNALCTGVECHLHQNDKIKAIYLIYARDTPEFMSVMVNFRILLRRLTGCKVYDVYDDDVFNEIALSPNEWVQSHLQDPEIKVVFVVTECAQILYQNMMKFYTNSSDMEETWLFHVYRQPSYSDSILMYSLKLISFDITSMPYHKYFVVRFPKFNHNNDYMSHINPFKRFDMPENLKVLVENILHRNKIGHSKNEPEHQETKELDRLIPKSEVNEEVFVKSIKDMYQFFANNPDYLMKDILQNEVKDPSGGYYTIKTSRSNENV